VVQSALGATNMMNREVVLRLFLSAAGTYYAAFADEAALEAAVAWFNDNFEWRESYNGDDEAAANDMVAAFAGIESSEVGAEAKRQAEVLSERRKKMVEERIKQMREKNENKNEPSPKKRKQSQSGGGGSSGGGGGGGGSSGGSGGGGGSSGGGSSNISVPLAGPAPDAVSALVAFLRAFAAMTEAEQRALLEKLQRQ
jgi:hypothetical protein